MFRRRPAADRAPEAAVASATGDWAWMAAGGGPDITFRARVAAGTESQLARLVAAMPLPGFVMDDVTPSNGEIDRTSHVDRATYEALREQHASGQRSNIYIFNDIGVTGRELVIVRGYGGRPDPALHRVETRLLARLALSFGADLEHWAVRQEGYGPGSDRSFVEGETGSELFDHLFYGEVPPRWRAGEGEGVPRLRSSPTPRAQ